MEFLGVLEPEDAPKELMWYAFVPGGNPPSPRVGHTCIFVPASVDDGGKGKVVVVGGADPGCCFSDVHIINLDKYEWDNPCWEGLLPRYEHASFTSISNPGSIWVFGGAEQAENRNSVQLLNPGRSSWKSPKVEGSSPTPRTYHTSSAAIGDKFYVFGGGERGAEPVDDNKLHVFDITNLTWTEPETAGDPPRPRHGHVLAALGSKLFIHGGMAGSTFFSDMSCIDTGTMKWEKLKVKGDRPPACAAHSALSWEKSIYIYGGMTETGAIGSMHRYDTEKNVWTQLKFDSPSPAPRLDHSMCFLPWKIRTDISNSEKVQGDVNEKGDSNDLSVVDQVLDHTRHVPLCLIFGGMDTNGELYNDCYVTALQK
ncbi:rab9 effector protein with kelch motifs [Pseudophryne corroboree]|uniref:rab9 effector protein with kelch motifs n=1 Tax=Pseudophryne corroboree TaxID=495146 RepID=UPI0030817C4D